MMRSCLLAGVALWLTCSTSTASILEDVTFDDPAGTEIENAANVAGTGHLFDADADLAGVTTNGLGQLNASLKANNEFGTTYIDSDDIASGPVYAVMELTWDFDTATLDPAELEEVRLSLIQFDPRSTFVTGEFEITREANGNVEIFGNAVGTGAVDIPAVTLTPTQSEKFIAVLALHLGGDVMELHYSADDGASFTTLTGGVLDPTRGVGSLRMTLNNDLSQDNILIDRVYMTDMNPFPGLIPDVVPEPASLVLSGLGVAGLLSFRRRTRR